VSGTRRTTRASRLAVLVLAQLAVGARAFAGGVVLDDFEELSGWTALASEGARVWMVPEPGAAGRAMRVGFDLSTGGGWVIVRKTFSLVLPENYAFGFHLHGEARPNNFEFKIVDAAGKSVWWRNQRAFAFPAEWQRLTVRKSRLEFAWGPAGGTAKRVGAIEFAVAAGEGGSGWFALDELAFEEREAAAHNGRTPRVQASTFVAGHEPARMVDPDPATGWRSEADPVEQLVEVDFAGNRELGGLVIDWDPEDYATAYEVQLSNGAPEWTTAFATAAGNGGRDYIYLPDAECHALRLRLQAQSRGQGYAIRSLTVKPTEFGASPNQFFEAIARDGPVGRFPKYFYGRQTYWTVVGVDGDTKQALLNEEGMLEVDKGSFSIEPFVYAGGEFLTWHAAQIEQELKDGYLPMPSVTRRHERVALRVDAFAGGGPGASMLYARYRLENRGERPEPVRLFLAIRPFQVNPPWQSLNTTGGATAVHEIKFDGRVVWVNRQKAVVTLVAPEHFGAGTFEDGSVTDFLAAGTVPARPEVSDPFGFASGALAYGFHLEPRGHAEVDIAVPFHDPYVAAVPAMSAEDSRAFVAGEEERVRRHWRGLLGRVEVDLPPDAEKLTRTVKTTLAYILINRDGPALQPGARNYARSWIRDGAVTSAALLQMGFTEEVREFLRWFAGYQGADGKVPCCVDRRGADPVLEHDSAGQFIYAVMEYYRYTRDVGFLADMWPHVVGAVEYLTALRARRMTDEYRTPEREAYFGLLPESISHEGYSTRPVHSYWDDFYALRGLKDAAAMAVVVGDTERAEAYARLRDGFRDTLHKSIVRTVAQHGIDYLPGSVELGDFDPTSTAVALAPGGELESLPAPVLARTFDRYFQEVEGRTSGEVEWEAYSAYEVRNVEAFVRLGDRRRALHVLEHLVADQRPPAWNEWAEITWRDPAAPRFVGDMPHTWVGAGFISAVRSLLAYEREADRSLVLAAGVPARWVRHPRGVVVRRLPTHYGVLNYTLRAEGPDRVRLVLTGDLTVPPGKIVVPSPLSRRLRAVIVNGRAIEASAPDRATIGEFPADAVLEHEPAGADERG
jgi:hypothetical protein